MLSSSQFKKLLEEVKGTRLAEYVETGTALEEGYSGHIPESMKVDPWYMRNNKDKYTGPKHLFDLINNPENEEDEEDETRMEREIPSFEDRFDAYAYFGFEIPNSKLKDFP